jgi:HEPN domain-containing protein
MNDKRTHGKAWLAKAESDRLAARRLLDAGGPYDAVCFHAQQACEKALKAVLASANVEIPRTHNLEELQARCLAAMTESQRTVLATLDLVELTPYAVETRYDAEFWPDRATADAASHIADDVVEAVARLLISVER